MGSGPKALTRRLPRFAPVSQRDRRDKAMDGLSLCLSLGGGGAEAAHRAMRPPNDTAPPPAAPRAGRTALVAFEMSAQLLWIEKCAEEVLDEADAMCAQIDSLDDEREASTGAVPHAPQLPPAAPPPARSHDGESVRAAGSTSDSAEGEERPPKRLNKGKGKAKVS